MKPYTVTFAVSIDVDSETEEAAMLEARAVFRDLLDSGSITADEFEYETEISA